MSVKIELYNLVKAAVSTVPEIKTFGHFNNQFATERDEQPFNNPAVFFQFVDVPWLPSSLAVANPNASQEQKSQPVQFTLHISFWDHKNEEDKFLGLLDVVDKVYRAVANIESNNINPIQRINDEDDPDHTEPIVWRTTFSTMLSECGKALNVAPINPGIKIITLNT